MRKTVIRMKCFHPKRFHKAKYFDKLKFYSLLRKNMKEGLRRALAMLQVVSVSKRDCFVIWKEKTLGRAELL